MVNKHRPMLLINVIPGLEERNIRFMVSHGYAKTADTPEALALLAGTLLRDTATLAKWRETLARDFSGSAAAEIYGEICQDLGVDA